MANIQGYLDNIRSAASGETVRDSIISCLNLINNDNPTTIKPINITANGTYTSQTGFAYNPVTVNVPTGAASNLNYEEIEITENGEYEPEDEDTVFSKVTVDVPQFAKDLMETKEITQNGEYEAFLDGYDGYAKVVIKVDEQTGEGPFTVIFYDSDKTKKLQTVQVDKYANAVFNPSNGYPTPPVGQTFCGWEPNPVNVTRDMNCYPNFQQTSIIVGEIADDWSVICGKAGSGYSLGSYKSLPFGANITEAEIQAVDPSWAFGDLNLNFTGIALKVAEGEGGTTSSWLWQIFEPNLFNNIREPDRYFHSWPGSRMIQFLNIVLFGHMSDIFKSSIKPVIKYTQNSTSNHVPYNVVPEQNYIWVPSVKEMMCTNDDSIGYLVPAYGEKTQFETAFDKYYTQVPQSIAYFRDILQWTTAQREQALMRPNGYRTPLRDNTDSWESEAYISESTNIIENHRNQNYSLMSAEYAQVTTCLGFCM